MSAAQFTNIRIESPAYDTTILRFEYAGSNAISIFRALNGGAFSEIIEFPSDYGDTPVPFYDANLDEQTYYDYKLSDDNGSTFTDVVSVKTQKNFLSRAESSTESERVALPNFTGEDDVNPQNLQDMVDSLTNLLNGPTIAAPRNCDVCPNNGALILDCATGCYHFTIRASDIENINSISSNCRLLEIDFDIPEGTETEICGWSDGSQFEGDECFQAPALVPITNLPVSFDKPKPCQIERIRYPSAPCIEDYHHDCYDKGSLVWGGSPLAYSVDDCASTPSQTSSNDGLLNMNIWSGDKSKSKVLREANPLAGFTIAYKSLNSHMSGAPAEANIWEFGFNLSNGQFANTALRGKPIFGMAINVPQDVTVTDFTGRVLLWNYQTSLLVYGQYTNANLREGTLPTTIASTAIANVREARLFIDNTPGNIYSNYNVYVEDSSNNVILDVARTTITLAGSEPLGAGFFWVANPSWGEHAANIRIPIDLSFFISWWG